LNYTTLESFPAFSVGHFDIKPQNVVKQTISFIYKPFATMKNVIPKTAVGPKKSPPVLPLEEDEEAYRLDETNSITWELSTQPGTANAATYKYQVRILTGSKTPRQLVRWRMDLNQVVAGLNLTMVATIKPVHLACMRTGPKAIYDASCDASMSAEESYEVALQAAIAADAATGGGATAAQDAVRARGARVSDLNLALGMVISDLLPRQVLAKAKRSLRRDTRKPVDMKVRKY
jgi:hypothetical protein